MPPRSLRPAAARLIPASLALALGVPLAGCARSPVAEDASRSPYERYDDLRGREVPRTTVDSFGRERLNLEGRLGGQGGDG